MKLSLITNDVRVAQKAEEAGVERILIDLERAGKAARQAGRSLFLSTHQMEDVRRIKLALGRTEIAVRVDPLHSGTREQIDLAVAYGADLIVLPFFQRLEEAAEFVALLQKRAAAVLLVETASAAVALGELCRLPGVAEIHIGLNDLSISLGLPSWFELLTGSVLEKLCATLRASTIPFGFGGIACLSRLDLPINPELVLAEQVCQGATRGWLSRTFREVALPALAEEVQQVRKAIAFWNSAGVRERAQMRVLLSEDIESARQSCMNATIRERALQNVQEH